MSIFILYFIIILIIIYLFQTSFFESFNNYNSSKLYMFVSSSCPACKMYENNNHNNVDKAASELGIKLHKVNVDTDLNKNKYLQKIYQNCQVQYIPTACLITNDKVYKNLGNGNSLTKEIIKLAL